MTPFQQLLNFDTTIQFLWEKMSEALEKDHHLSANLKEEVRKTLAQENGCLYCKAKGKPNPRLYDEKTAVCTGYAEAFLKSKGQTPLVVTEVLNDYLKKEERDELLAFICFITASQYLGALQQLQPIIRK
ncbi:alkylhydroperoxidase [Kurthia senegalensis]|uniref:alkylhydroperoxidase n=1 Tax=Kurthia senegalensis TaxID=1033740 RepID=UPI00028A2693|nr:alkylhydroperoxidase [Kurthia senegalensis]